MEVAREACAYFLAKRFLRVASNYHAQSSVQSPASTTTETSPSATEISPRHIALASGCAPLVSNVFFCLGHAGDVCLIPAPYYAAFESDMHLVAGILPFPVRQDNPARGPTKAELQTAFDAAVRELGVRPKFVLLCNPNNPLGVCYSPGVVQDVVQWARSHGMHTLVDELYALSVHQQQPTAARDVVQNGGAVFESVIETLQNQLSDDVHMLWAVSKDFGCSGLRFGLVYTQNETLLQALSCVNIFSGIGGPIQYLVAELRCPH